MHMETTRDLDDAKYDRRLKRRLRKSRQRSRGGPWLMMVMALVLAATVIWWGWRHREASALAHFKWQYARAQQLSEQQRSGVTATSGGEQKKPSGEGGDEEDDTEDDVHPIEKFAKIREYFIYDHDKSVVSNIRQVLREWKDLEDQIIRDNIPHETPRWIRPYLLPNSKGEEEAITMPRGLNNKRKTQLAMFSSVRPKHSMKWEEEYKELVQEHDGDLPGPVVDYTNPDLYDYPEIMRYPDKEYPKLQKLGDILTNWPQDEDFTGDVFTETLLHFNYSDPKERAMAERFRDAELPFKVYDIPELEAAGRLWTDEYVAKGFNSGEPGGTAQESLDNYFAFYVPENWNPQIHGLPPTRNNDWTFRQWSQHARYADATRLSASHPHFYWQSGVAASERMKDESAWSFVTRDLRLFSATKGNFFVFHPESQKGIQCRFGERGVVAATHFDGGRNMVGMITGAKRYILAPPNQCSRLGIFTGRDSPIYRHSLLNFGHIRYINEYGNGMSSQEREWLTRASTSQSLETVLKAGEVLYIPSHWFHYIVSLQKSAQCNVRSGMNNEGSPRFGGRADVEECA
jgi:Cupin-like domain